MLRLSSLAGLCVLVLSGAFPLVAQDSKMLADKIVAIVGDRIILYSELQAPRPDGDVQPNHPDCNQASQLIQTKLLSFQAERESITVDEAEVEAELNLRIRYFIRLYGSPAAVEHRAGKSIAALKESFRPDISDQLLAREAVNRATAGLNVSPAEVRKYFEQLPPDHRPFLPASFEIASIVAFPMASPAMRTYVTGEMERIREQVVAHSTGLSGWRPAGDGALSGHWDYDLQSDAMAPVILRELRRLKPGEISRPVFDRNRVYLLEIDQKEGNSVSVHYVVKSVPVTSEDIQLVRQRLDSIRKRVQSGAISFEQAAGLFNQGQPDRSGTGLRSPAGAIQWTADDLQGLASVVQNLKVGEISEPVEYEDPAEGKGLTLVLLKWAQAAHIAGWETDYALFAGQALEEKRQKALRNWLGRRNPEQWVVVDPEIAVFCKEFGRYTH